jgi:eukaryotic-like serine/threonine-protein kinase
MRQSAETRAPQSPARRIRWAAAAVLMAVALAAASALIVLRLQRPDVAARLEYTQLTSFADSATSPALSPDGRMLAFIRGEHTFGGPGQIYVKLLPNGEPVQLTHDDLNKRGSPKFSPGGARLAYAAFKPGSTWDTWVVPVLAGQPRLFLANRYGPPGVSWSPDGKFLYLNLQGSIYAIPLRPGQMLPIPASGFNRRKMWLPCRARG